MTRRNAFKCPLHDGHLFDYEHDVSDMTCPKCGMAMEVYVRFSLLPPLPTMAIDELTGPTRLKDG